MSMGFQLTTAHKYPWPTLRMRNGYGCEARINAKSVPQIFPGGGFSLLHTIWGFP